MTIRIVDDEPEIMHTPGVGDIYLLRCQEDLEDRECFYSGDLEFRADGRTVLSGNGKLFSKYKVLIYDGGWRNGKRHGQGIHVDRDGCVHELEYKYGFRSEEVIKSREFYGKNGEICDENSGERRKLYTITCDLYGNYSTVIHYSYGPNGILEEELMNMEQMKEELRKEKLRNTDGRFSAPRKGTNKDKNKDKNKEIIQRTMAITDANELKNAYRLMPDCWAFLDDDALSEIFMERITALIGEKEKKMGTSFDEKTKEHLKKKYHDRLLKRIKEVTLGCDSDAHIHGIKIISELRSEFRDFFIVAGKIGTFRIVESEFSEALSQQAKMIGQNAIYSNSQTEDLDDENDENIGEDAGIKESNFEDQFPFVSKRERYISEPRLSSLDRVRQFELDRNLTEAARSDDTHSNSRTDRTNSKEQSPEMLSSEGSVVEFLSGPERHISEPRPSHLNLARRFKMARNLTETARSDYIHSNSRTDRTNSKEQSPEIVPSEGKPLSGSERRVQVPRLSTMEFLLLWIDMLRHLTKVARSDDTHSNSQTDRTNSRGQFPEITPPSKDMVKFLSELGCPTPVSQSLMREINIESNGGLQRILEITDDSWVLLNNDALSMVLEIRIASLIEKKEKEIKTSFDDETKKRLREKYHDHLSRRIGEITPESIKDEYGVESPKVKVALQALRKSGIFYAVENEFSEELLSEQRAELGRRLTKVIDQIEPKGSLEK
ncbi:MAG: MORN repeat-containing protein [Rickettsiales bacterium]|jgi:hypothetical protein|nr:MORN repeat-containing protein [Rickettsiales bacterium]